MKNAIDAILQRRQAEYLDTLLPAPDALLGRMEALAAEERQPIADPEVAQLVRLLITVRKPAKLLEIGTNIGYSVIVMGRACPAQSTIETIELDSSILAKAKGFVAEAKLACGVLFHQGAALEVLPALEGPFDFVFIDCVKTEYGDYLDAILPKLSPDAIIVCDNLLWGGKVADGVHDPSTDALRAFNARLTSHPDLLTTILPVGDGTGVSVRRDSSGRAAI